MSAAPLRTIAQRCMDSGTGGSSANHRFRRGWKVHVKKRAPGSILRCVLALPSLRRSEGTFSDLLAASWRGCGSEISLSSTFGPMHAAAGSPARSFGRSSPDSGSAGHSSSRVEWPDNAPARNFYEKAGFRTVELRLVVDIDTVERRLAADS